MRVYVDIHHLIEVVNVLLVGSMKLDLWYGVGATKHLYLHQIAHIIILEPSSSVGVPGINF